MDRFGKERGGEDQPARREDSHPMDLVVAYCGTSGRLSGTDDGAVPTVHLAPSLRFESHNIRQAYATITDEDRRRLPWDPESIDWNTYWRRNQIEGIKKWVEPEAVRQWAFKI